VYYRIIPLEPNSIVKQECFIRSDLEFKCGIVWRIGSLVTKIKPAFLRKYNPNLGIAISEINGAEISEIYKGKKIIRFSNNISEDEEVEISEIFYGVTRKFSGTYQDIFQDLGWKLASTQFLIYGELEVRETH
jgi:hypothetical protein